MAEPARLAAIDIGADTGRSVVGVFDGSHLKVEEVHRFPNRPVEVDGTLYWDVLRLFADAQDGIRAAGKVRSVGIDTWGVDFGLLDRSGRLLANPVHYRDRRTKGMIDAATRLVSREEIYLRTGIQFLPINTLYQLLALARAKDQPLEVADRLLMMPALLTYWLTGAKADEYTNATTTQCFDTQAGTWAADLLDRMGIPVGILGEVVKPGTDLGPPLVDIDIDARRVIATATHDTASAVAAVPFESHQDSAYISSGTWSLVGIETHEAIITADAMNANISNEGGAGGTFRVLKNVMGLWLLQECQRGWAAQGMDMSYQDMLGLAEAATPFAAVVDPDDERLLRPGDMAHRIVDIAAESGQHIAPEPGPIVRCILESLALKYRETVAMLSRITGSRIRTIHIVGGGANNRLLCQMTADACGCYVLAGPAEATAIGNLLVQAIALGLVANMEEGRDLVRRSWVANTYEPGKKSGWTRFQVPA